MSKCSQKHQLEPCVPISVEVREDLIEQFDHLGSFLGLGCLQLLHLLLVGRR
jgi:hypothetical protein